MQARIPLLLDRLGVDSATLMVEAIDGVSPSALVPATEARRVLKVLRFGVQVICFPTQFFGGVGTVPGHL